MLFSNFVKIIDDAMFRHEIEISNLEEKLKDSGQTKQIS